MSCPCYNKNKIYTIVPTNCDVMWVGISLKKNMNISDALNPAFASGNLLYKIEEKNTKLTYYRTNIIKCAPINKNNKLRYPTYQEMENCYPTLLEEINIAKPKFVFLLGSLVAKFVFDKLNISHSLLPKDYNYIVKDIEGIKYVAIHHPSYINVYKRNSENEYIKAVSKLMECND